MKTILLWLTCMLSLVEALGATEPTRRLNVSEFELLAGRCAPGAPLTTLEAIARVESGFYPLALSVNYPLAASSALGLAPGGMVLTRQPSTLPEALGWVRWFTSRKLSVSIGLMQVSSEHLDRLALTPEQAFEPCVNVRAGWLLFSTHLRRAQSRLGTGSAALHAALSDYNSGSLTAGYTNGYVERILKALPILPRVSPIPSQPTERPVVPGLQSGDNAENDPNEVPTGVPWSESKGWDREAHGKQTDEHQGQPRS